MRQDEARFIQRVADHGCIVCRLFHDCESPAEIHHIRAGMGTGQRNDSWHILPLCPLHHRTGGYSIAFHAGPKGFESSYDSEINLYHSLLKSINGGITNKAQSG